MPTFLGYNPDLKNHFDHAHLEDLALLTEQDLAGLEHWQCVKLGIQWNALFTALMAEEGEFNFTYDRKFHSLFMRTIERRSRSHQIVWSSGSVDDPTVTTKVGKRMPDNEFYKRTMKPASIDVPAVLADNSIRDWVKFDGTVMKKVWKVNYADEVASSTSLPLGEASRGGEGVREQDAERQEAPGKGA